LREVRSWNDIHAKPLARFIKPHENDPSPDRKLKIGYVSPDFRAHVVGWNLLPLLRGHDRERFEIFCYADVRRPDEFTEKLRSHADQWRSLVDVGDEQAAELIRRDQIDILVDLTVHTANHRLLVFAHKPSPVQVTYLGYCGGTGMETMDYRLSDPYLDPPGAELNYVERTVRLPGCYWCYEPGGVAPEVSPLPAPSAGHVTFACLNKFSKVSAPAMDLWAEVLRRVPGSRLIIHATPGNYLRKVLGRFAGAGVSPDRLEFVGWQNWRAYMETYGRIDISLDPFPFGGGITTFDSLWMGVPVVTLSGRTAVGRGAHSILANVGLPELVATTGEEYVRIGVELAGDLPRLTTLRAGLRSRMESSPLMDGRRFAGNVEAAYREMWRGWCAKRSN
jgi:predicted O-linked N-acetylglucosamine transferase (SPINDLY family)